MGDAFGGEYLILPTEAEALIESLCNVPLDEIGLESRWMTYHTNMEKLNLQAHQSVQKQQDNFVVEGLLTYNKFPLVIGNMLQCEIWKQKVYPRLQTKSNSNVALRVYFILYHEALLCNLLELAFAQEHVIQSMDEDYILEVVDFCLRKITWLLSLSPKQLASIQNPYSDTSKEAVSALALSTEPSLDQQSMELDFRVAVQSITLLRYVSEKLHLLSLGVVSRLLDKHDVLLSLVPLVENPPWTCRTTRPNGDVVWKKFVQQKWKTVEAKDLLQLTSTEAQVWIAIYYLLCTKSARDQYEITSFRKNQLVRIRKFMNDVLVDQLPMLVDIQRYLDELAITNVDLMHGARQAKSSLVMETVPYIRQSIHTQFKNRYDDIAQDFDTRGKSMERRQDLMQLADLYQLDGIDELVDEGFQEPIREEDKEKDKDVERVDELMIPTTVKLIFDNVANRAASHEPLIQEISTTSDSTSLPSKSGNVLPQVEVECIVDATQVKMMENGKLQYYRYPMKKKSEALTIAATSKVDAHISFAPEEKAIDGLDNQDESTIVTVSCGNLKLPTSSTQKMWTQLGSLQDGSLSVIQCQCVPHTSIRDTYTIGSVFLCVPF